MKNENYLANKLHQLGFRTKVRGGQWVEVWLMNRKASTMEVKQAVDENIDTMGIDLQYSSFWNGVSIVWNK